jgi:hypothetical protein
MNQLREIFPSRSDAEIKDAFLKAGESFDLTLEILLGQQPEESNKNPRRPHIVAQEISDGEEENSDEAQARTKKDLTILAPKALSQDDTIAQLLLVFPDACPDFIKKSYNDNYILQGANIVGFLADKFVEGGYTRVENALKRKRVQSNPSSPVHKRSKYDSPDRYIKNIEEYQELV